MMIKKKEKKKNKKKKEKGKRKKERERICCLLQTLQVGCSMSPAHSWSPPPPQIEDPVSPGLGGDFSRLTS